MIDLLAALLPFAFFAGFCLGIWLWRRSIDRDLAQIQRLDDAFEEYKAIVHRTKRVVVRGEWT